MLTVHPDDKKTKGIDTPSTNSVGSPGPVVNQLDDSARETFATGRPLEDSPDLQQCKHCKKSILKTAAKTHVVACLKAKKEKAQRKKEQKEVRDREKKEAAMEKDDDGDTRLEDDDEDGDDASPEKKVVGGLKSAKKSTGKKAEESKGKKRKADGDGDKDKKKQKKADIKPKTKVKGTNTCHLLHLPPVPISPYMFNYRGGDSLNTTTVRMMGKPSTQMVGEDSHTSLLDELITDKTPKGPVDVERQCGVMKDGVPCARSLTCKSHSMGAKRAVPGRSLPYDMLLTAYQKKNQAKQQSDFTLANLQS